MHRVTLGSVPKPRHDLCLMAHMRKKPFGGILYANRIGTHITVPLDGLVYVNNVPHEPGEVVPVCQGDAVMWCPGCAC